MTIHNNYKVEVRCSKDFRDCVSLFSGYSDSKPVGVVSLSDFLLQPVYKEQVEVIRNCRDKAKRRELKSKLPAVTPSGVFSKRSNAGLIKHSGYLCIDIDGDQNPGISDWEALKSSISDLAGLWYAGSSVGGNGLFLIFKVAQPQRHPEHFAALAMDLRERGITIDAACKDVARLRGASYDSKPLYSPLVAPYKGFASITPKNPEKPRPGFTPYPSGLTARRVDMLVNTIERTGANIADYYPDWYAIGCSIASEFGESGRGWFHAISRPSEKYDPAECDEQFSRCLSSCSKTSINTLFWHCKQHGITTRL